ncbi:MAG TPA: YgiT-type zinc finger protein [Thermoanaerobaculia bacterium]|nr:YgiT-type zinc finger protein [Thermoanaerobaculia bacterium]
MAMPDRLSSPFTRQEYGIPSTTTLREVRPVDLDATLPIVRRLPTPVQILPMRCLCCQGTVERTTARVKLERGGCRLEWEAVPAWVCTRCGQSYFEPPEVERIQLASKALAALSR